MPLLEEHSFRYRQCWALAMFAEALLLRGARDAKMWHIALRTGCIGGKC